MVIFTGKGHVGVTLIILYLMNPALEFRSINLWFVAGALIGSFLPDCDTPHAFAGQILPLWLLGVKHRRQTHSLFAAAIFALLTASINMMFGVGMALGYILHLLGDRMTYSGQKNGLPYFLWYPGKKIKGAG